MHHWKSPLKWASMSRRNPRGLGRCLECIGHFPHSCLCHPCVPTKPQGNISFGKTNAQVYESVMELSYPRRFMEWRLTQLLSKSSQGICHSVNATAPSPPLCDLPGYSFHSHPLPEEDCGKAEDTRQGRSCYFWSISMSGTMFPGSRHSCDIADLSVP